MIFDALTAGSADDQRDQQEQDQQETHSNEPSQGPMPMFRHVEQPQKNLDDHGNKLHGC
jgi:hypothetical protein